MLPLLKKHWAVLAQTSTWIGVVLATFLLPPPGLAIDAASNGADQHFAQWLVSVIGGLILVMTRLQKKGQRTVRLWTVLSCGAACIAVAGFGTYELLKSDWSVIYVDDRRLVVGTQPSAEAGAAIARLGARPSDHELLGWFAGRSEEAWQGGEVRRRALILHLLFIGAWVACATTMMFVVSALSATDGPARRGAEAGAS